jgi:hypothetical protein
MKDENSAKITEIEVNMRFIKEGEVLEASQMINYPK